MALFKPEQSFDIQLFYISDHVNVGEVLVAHDADVDAKGKSGSTPLLAGSTIGKCVNFYLKQ